MTTYQTEIKKQRLVIIIGLAQKYYLAFHEGQFLVDFFLIFSWQTSFFVVKDIDITSYADDSTPFIVKNNIDNVIASLEQLSDALLKNNRLKDNVDKCHVLVSTNKPVGIKIGDYTIDNSECRKLLGVKIDVNINFNDNISDLCKKASRKISAIARVTPFMGLSKRKLLMNAFFISRFSYCPLIWMCHSSNINMLHERYLRIVYNDKQSSFTELLNKDSSDPIHIRNIKRLAIELFRLYNGLLPPLMNNIIFKLRAKNSYNLRQVSEISRPMVKSVYHGTGSTSYLGPKIWNILPEKLKNIENLEHFKKEIETWKPDNCPCRLCKVSIASVGFL